MNRIIKAAARHPWLFILGLVVVTALLAIRLPALRVNISASGMLEKDTPAYTKAWKRASENFLKSFNDYMDLMGMVPKDKHLALIKKYEELKEKVAAQEETINHLKMLLEEKKTESQEELVQGFQDLIEKQSKQFQETMETFGRFFKKE